MQTKFENAKQDTHLAQEKAREQAALKAEAEQKISVMQKTVQEREQDLNCNKITIANKEQEMAGLQG